MSASNVECRTSAFWKCAPFGAFTNDSDRCFVRHIRDLGGAGPLFFPSNVDPETPRRHSSPVEVSIDVASPAVAVALAKKPDLNLWRLCLGLWALMFFTSSAVTQEHSYS